jgi:diguanylate cyclase (GGDEF)-like protein
MTQQEASERRGPSIAAMILSNLLLTVAYIAAGHVSLLLKHPLMGSITPLWLPTAIGLVGLMVFGFRVFPGIALGHMLSSALNGLPLTGSAVAACAGACELLLAKAMLRRGGVTLANLLDGVQPMLRFIVWAVLPGAAMGAAVGVTGFMLIGIVPQEAAIRGLAFWFAGDFVGMLLVVPTLAALRADTRLDWSPRALAPFLLAVVPTVVIFFLTDPSREGHHVYGYLIFPFVVWGALVMPTAMAITTHLVVAGVAILGTALGYGPYAVTSSVSDVWLLQAFVVAMVCTSLMLRAAMEDRRRNFRRAEHMALHDSLTGLPNRRSMQEVLDTTLTDAGLTGGKAGLLFVDLDDFKAVNDAIGHDGGDQVLTQIARRLQAAARGGETVTRPGGDEFVVIANQGHGHAPLSDVAQRIIDVLREPVGSREFRLTCSVGIARFPDDAHDARTLMRYADIAMYQAKAAGKNTHEFYCAQMQDRWMRRMAMENALRGALERGEFQIVYQPQIDMDSRELVGAEALLRWRSQTLGDVPPEIFIPVAEDIRVVGAIGRWVIESVCAQLREWIDAGREAPRVAINLSPLQLDAELPHEWSRAMAQAKIAPELLEAELTESCVMRDAEANADTLRALSALGVRISLDDFGTGHSSLSMLTRLPLNAVKIDQSFVQNIRQAEGAQVVSAIVTLAHRLGLDCMAEGVETEAQEAYLREIGCDAYQGYLLSRPLPAEVFAHRFLPVDAVRTTLVPAAQ